MNYSNQQREAERTPLLPKTVPHEHEASARQLVSVALSVFALIFFVSCNTSIMTTTGGVVAAEFDAFEYTSWMASCYMIASSCATPLAGRLSAVFTSRVVSFAAALLFALGAILTATAQSFPHFLVGRVIAGLGGGGLLSSAIVVVLDLASVRRRGVFLGVVNSAFTTGISLGGVLGGYMTAISSWRLAFWVQVPGVAIASLASLYVSSDVPAKRLDERSIRQKLASLDYLGTLTLDIAICLLLYSFAAHSFPLHLFLISLATFLVFGWLEKRHPEPIIPVGLLVYPPLTCAALTSLIMMISRWILIFYTPAWVMAIRGAGTSIAGLSLIPTSLGFGLGSILFGHFFLKHNGSYYWSAVVSCLAFTLSYVVLLCFTPATSLVWFAANAAANGVATGAALTFAMGHLLYTLPPHVQPIGAALMTAFRGMGGSFGSAIAGGVVARHLEEELTEGFQAHHPVLTPGDRELIRQLKGAPSLVWEQTGWAKQEAMHAYFVSMKGVFGVALALACVAAALQAMTALGVKHEQTKEEEESQQQSESPEVVSS